MSICKNSISKNKKRVLPLLLAPPLLFIAAPSGAMPRFGSEPSSDSVSDAVLNKAAVKGSPDTPAPGESLTTPEPIINTPVSGIEITSADQATARVEQNRASLRRVDSIRAWRTSFSRLTEPDGPAPGLILPAGIAADQSVWVVLVVGDYRPQFAKGSDLYRWGIEVLDPRTGVPLASFAGTKEVPGMFAGTGPGLATTALSSPSWKARRDRSSSSVRSSRSRRALTNKGW